MHKKFIAITLVIALLLSLCACSREEPTHSDAAPGRMVRRIEVAFHPANPDFARTYVTQENMNTLLTLLRDMENAQLPESEPDLEGGQSYFSATITFANGQQSIYYLLGHSHLRLGDNPWCIITTDQAMEFIEFLRSHPSDDGSAVIETTSAPTETAAPTE